MTRKQCASTARAMQRSYRASGELEDKKAVRGWLHGFFVFYDCL